ncbi:MAG: ATP-dependent Clp protease ATP-binding subunit, partial [Planctomycetes bacterium]|nr:ATP-dependent Clp protease ATP-binding subunit [Planctomycetota bacterium]
GRSEEHHGLTISDEAIDAAVRLGARYLTERQLPDKAIDLIDEAASRHVIQAESLPDEVRDLKTRLDEASARLDAAAARADFEEAARIKQEVLQVQDEYRAHESDWRSESGVSDEVSESDIAALVAQMTGIPVDRMLEGEAEKLLQMEEALHQRVVGQDEAIQVLADAIRRTPRSSSRAVASVWGDGAHELSATRDLVRAPVLRDPQDDAQPTPVWSVGAPGTGRGRGLWRRTTAGHGDATRGGHALAQCSALPGGGAEARPRPRTPPLRRSRSCLDRDCAGRAPRAGEHSRALDHSLRDGAAGDRRGGQGLPGDPPVLGLEHASGRVPRGAGIHDDRSRSRRSRAERGQAGPAAARRRGARARPGAGRATPLRVWRRPGRGARGSHGRARIALLGRRRRRRRWDPRRPAGLARGRSPSGTARPAQRRAPVDGPTG